MFTLHFSSSFWPLHSTTPLHLAARYGHEKIAKLLIDKGASVTQKNAKGHNPLVTAILHGKCEVSEAIIGNVQLYFVLMTVL